MEWFFASVLVLVTAVALGFAGYVVYRLSAGDR